MDVSRFWWNQPERGELVVLRSPVNAKQKFVKRIVGLPGDRIRIAARKLYVNGAAVAEPYVMRLGEAADEYRDNFPGTPNVGVFAGAETMLAQYVRGGEVVVPEGNYFVLGDNRDVSLDSRYWGFVAREALLGRPLFVYASAAGRPHLRWVD